jgi:hypothetical protein
VRDTAQLYFRERRLGEVRRIPLLQGSVNRGKTKGRGCYAPALAVQRVHLGAGFMERIQPPAAASFSKNSPSFSTDVSGWVSMRT